MQQLRVVAVGHIDHGKSTLIGRLLHDSGNFPDGKVEELRAAASRRGAAFEWSFVLDAMQSERDLAITIDTTRLWLRTPERDIVLIDAPGHKEFLRNMVTGASGADAALLVVDAHDGVSEQTRRHALVLQLIGIERVVVAINKMDSVGYEQARYNDLRSELQTILGGLGIVAVAFIPTSARRGENVVASARGMAWYEGTTVLATLLELPVRSPSRAVLRLPVQGVLRRELQRTFVGRIESGELRVGETVLVAPAMRRARIASIDVWPAVQRRRAGAGESIGFTLEEALFVERGDIVADTEQPPVLATSFRVRLLWLGARPLAMGAAFQMRIGTRAFTTEVASFDRVVSIDALDVTTQATAHMNDVAEVVLRSREPQALDTVETHPGLGRFILLDGIEIVAGGTVLALLDTIGTDITRAGHSVTRTARARKNGHRGAVIWLTGLPASGKTSIAMELERRLFDRGVQTYVLDGDNLRSALCSDLGFSASDRSENIRRAAEVAALFADAGAVAIAAFISPFAADRVRARAIAGDAFQEVYVRADVTVCERRDPKGHYRKARAGLLLGYTGISGDYEAPAAPDLILDTGLLDLDSAVTRLENFVLDRVIERLK